MKSGVSSSMLTLAPRGSVSSTGVWSPSVMIHVSALPHGEACHVVQAIILTSCPEQDTCQSCPCSVLRAEPCQSGTTPLFTVHQAPLAHLFARAIGSAGHICGDQEGLSILTAFG